MKGQSKRNALLASLGLAALGVYILACTSFSPDDTKVLYPAYDSASGGMGMAVYDRETRKSEMLFVPVAYEAGNSNTFQVTPVPLRSQWLGNGSQVVVAYGPSQHGQRDAVDLAVIPWGSRKGVRIFQIPEIRDAAQALAVPLCVAGENVLLPASRTNFMRSDLKTGAIATCPITESEGDFSLYPALDGVGAFYFNSVGDKTVFGRLNPNDYSQTALVEITNRLRGPTAVAYDRDGTTLAMLSGDEDQLELFVWRDGKSVFQRKLDTHGRKRFFGNGVLAVNGKALHAAFEERTGTNLTSYGIMEVPFSDAPPREVVLLKGKGLADESDAYYFQMGVSHDGKTAAIASTYLTCSEVEIDPADVALFFVDLGSADWKVTKVPIPVPAERLRATK